MADHALEPERLADLRGRAASRLAGAAATKGSPARMADALSALHSLASSPNTASDALALLHELQVHQVELELQAEELRESRAELESALRHQFDLYDGQPVACFTIDLRLVVHELNRTASEMLGVAREDAQGAGLADFLSADGQRTLRDRLSSLEGSAQATSCLLKLQARNAPERLVRADIRAQQGTSRHFLVLTDTGDAHGSQPSAR